MKSVDKKKLINWLFKMEETRSNKAMEYYYVPYAGAGLYGAGGGAYAGWGAYGCGAAYDGAGA